LAAVRRATVLTVSNRAADGIYADRSGPVLFEGLQSLGFDVDGPHVVHDGEDVKTTLLTLVGHRDLVITSGGTGINPRDRTPEMTMQVIDYQIPGIAEALRLHGVSHGIPTAALSRGIAGVAGTTLIINVPGSPGAAKDAITVLGPILEHALEQLAGGDH
jgi:molybdenum cofactor synthesis domain-containing protein